MRTVKQVYLEIERAKERLKKLPICENFGDKEIHRLDNFIGDIYAYPYADRLKILTAHNGFAGWCMTYTGPNPVTRSNLTGTVTL